MRSMPHMSICSVVVVLEVAAPLAPTLDGGAVVFSRVTALELNPKIGRGEACHCWCARHHW
jgi:hypothetical protein